MTEMSRLYYGTVVLFSFNIVEPVTTTATTPKLCRHRCRPMLARPCSRQKVGYNDDIVLNNRLIALGNKPGRKHACIFIVFLQS